MRDAFGGSFMIKLFLVFILVYVLFTALALNYAKAFKVKNKVIEYLENNEVTDVKKMTAKEFTEMEDFFEKDILGNMNYRANIKCPETYEYCKNGIVITLTNPTSSNRNKLGVYHTVTTYFGFDISFFNILGSVNGNVSGNGGNGLGTWRISGQTKPIVNEQ